MPEKKFTQFLLLFFAAGIGGMIANQNSPSINDVHFSAYLGFFIGTGVGGALFTLVLSMVPSGIYRLAKGAWPKWMIWICFPMLVPILYLSYLGSSPSAWHETRSTRVQPTTEPHWFSDEQCDLAVGFPNEPTYRTNHMPGGIQMKEAHLNTDSGFHLRAECGNYGGIWDGEQLSAQDEDWVSWMYSFMDAEGLSNPQVSTDSDPATGRNIAVVDGRGHKVVNGVNATFWLRLLASRRSIMVLYAGGPSSRFPSRETTDFLDNYRLVSSSSPFDERIGEYRSSNH